jgi:hypothetical protein
MKTHPLNVSYLVVGLVFLGLAGSWLLGENGVIDLDSIQWLLPVTLVGAGAIGLIAFAAKGIGSRAKATEQDTTYDEPQYTPDYTSDIDDRLDAAPDERNSDDRL